MQKSKSCQNCEHIYIYPFFKKLVCFKSHAPQVYLPQNPLNNKRAWDRRCEDFAKKMVEPRQGQSGMERRHGRIILGSRGIRP